MYVSELINIISDISPDGVINIMPLSKIDCNVETLYQTKLWDSESLQAKYHREVKFGDSTWNAEKSNFANINVVEGTTEIAFQVRAYALLKYNSGNFEGGTGLKSTTLSGHTIILNSLSRFLLAKGYNSFHEACKANEVRLRTQLYDFFLNILKADVTKPKDLWFTVVSRNSSFGLFNERFCRIFSEVANELISKYHLKHHNFSHPIIPSRILKQLITWSSKTIKSSEAVIVEWEHLNKLIVKNIRTENKRVRSTNQHVASIIRNCINNIGVKDDLDSLMKIIKDLKLATLVSILTFTGMRIEEALACKIGCAQLIDGVYSIISTMTKTDDVSIDLPWVANKDCYDAVLLLERFTVSMRTRAKALLKSQSDRIQEHLLHNLKRGLDDEKLFGVAYSAKSISFSDAGRYTNFEQTDGKPHPAFNLEVTAEDIEQLNRAESNFTQVKGKERGKPYRVGQKFRLTPHMFRHTFAWFIVANRLGELDDIKYQFNHLSYAMSMVYSKRGIATIEEIVTLFEGFETLLTEKVAAEIADEAQEQSLGGGGGDKFNKAAQSLVIGITLANSDNEDTIRQIHFSSLLEYRDFLQMNMKNTRGLPHGYCTAGENCKIKSAGVPTGCVYCPNLIVVKRQMPHWAAMKRQAIGKLEVYENMTEDEQYHNELLAIQWRDTITAADEIMSRQHVEIEKVETAIND